ncbi:hypothetical protein MCAV_07440 [[Mycoplasma] cavipharyngis]|uniref:hypothetical protein n=1 Tax=[Mycoplasma] cavipharyngis TaxID=92757 RepID=UPI003704912A
MNFITLGSLFLIIILLVQLFTYYVYSFNLKVKYQKVKLTYCESILSKIQKSLTNKYQTNFKISLNPNFFKPTLNVAKNTLNLDRNFLNSNIYGLVNLVFLWKMCELIGPKQQKWQMGFKISAVILITTSWILLMLSFWMIAIAFFLAFLCVILIDFSSYYKIYQVVYIKSSDYLIQNYHQQHLNLILSYLKYKKFYILRKYLTFYIEIISPAIIAFKNWGKNE